MPPESTNSHRSLTVIIVSVVLVSAIIFAVLYAYQNQKVATPTIPTTTAPAEKTETPTVSVTASTTESLGGTIYENMNNPLQGKLPEQTPTANPINDAYKNPFQ